MSDEGHKRVCGPILLGPVDFFTRGAGFHVGKSKNFGMESIVVNVIVHAPTGDVLSRVEGIEVLEHELAYPSCCIENGGEACKEGDIEGHRQVKLLPD